MDRLAIVIGLGNPGAEYRDTRHNLGRWTLERLARRAGAALGTAGELGRVAAWSRAPLGERDVVLATPRTYMNRSGSAAAALCRAFDALPADLIVVHDDADLELGRIRVRQGGGAGGHNGLRSLIETLGDAGFLRVRLGVRGAARAESDLADYVLTPFAELERPIAEALAETGADAVESLLARGLQETMNRYNGLPIPGTATSRD